MEYNKVAAKWWADKIRNVGPGNFDNGDTSLSGGITMVLATMLAMDSEPSGKTIDLFEEKLANTIKEHVETHGTMTLTVDYVPDQILGRLAKETGVSPNVFPWKTTMWIKNNHVSVSSGYGNTSKTIFPEFAE